MSASQTATYLCLVSKYASFWSVEVDARISPPAILPSVLEHCRREIVELLVATFVLPPSALECVAVRRSNRHELATDDVPIREPSRKRKRLTPRPVSSPEEEASDDSDTPNLTLHLFNFGELKERWMAGDLKEVGRREIAIQAAHSGWSRLSANSEISELGGFPYSISEYAAIQSIPKSDMSKKRGNFDKLRAWINNSLPFTHFLVADGKRLLKFARDIERYNADVGLPAEIMKNNQLTSESAAVIRDILYANPKIGWASFPQLFNQFFVLMNGRAAKEHEFLSLPTIRNHVAQLDEFDRNEIRQSIKGLTEKLSPKGN